MRVLWKLKVSEQAKKHAMYSCGEFGNPSKSKAELEKKRNQLKMEMTSFDRMDFLCKRKAAYQAICQKIQERTLLGKNMIHEELKTRLEVSQNIVASYTKAVCMGSNIANMSTPGRSWRRQNNKQKN